MERVYLLTNIGKHSNESIFKLSLEKFSEKIKIKNIYRNRPPLALFVPSNYAP